MDMRISSLHKALLHPQQIPGMLKRRTRHLQDVTTTSYRKLYFRLYQLPSIDIDSVAPPLDEPVDVIMDHICLPPYLGPSTHDDVTPLMRIIKHVKPRVVLEFGTAHGNTVANICRSCEAYAFTVNALPEQLSGQFISYTLSKDEIGCVYRQHGFANRVTQIYANTLEFAPLDYIKDADVELVIIDACHDTEYVVNDFMKALKVVNKRAIVLFHDTHPGMENHLVGSYTACMKLRRRGFDVRHIRDTWWAIWQKR